MKKFFNIKLFFHLKTFFLQIMYILCKAEILKKKKIFFFNLVLQQMNNQTRVIQREKLRLRTSSKHKETTISHKRMHQKHVENLKSQLKDYKVDPSEDSSSIGISADQEISFSVLLGLLQSSELGNKMHLSFVKKRLVEGEKSIFEPISKSNIKTSNEKKKLQKNDFRSEGRQTGISCYCNKTK